MSAPTAGLPALIVQSLQRSSLHYLARALALLCWVSLSRARSHLHFGYYSNPAPLRGSRPGSGSVWMCRRPQLRVFCLSAAGTSFTDQEDESRAGEEGREVSGEQETYESRGKLARSELKVCWRCKSNLWWENTVCCVSSAWFAQPLKSNLRTNWRYRRGGGNTHNKY